MPLIQMHERLHLPFATTRRHGLQTSQVMSLNQGGGSGRGASGFKSDGGQFGKYFIYLIIHLVIDLFTRFLDTGLPRGNVHERDSGPIRRAIPTKSYNP